MGNPDAELTRLFGRDEAIGIARDLWKAPNGADPPLLRGLDLDQGPILVITGMHASGKSGLLHRLAEECRSAHAPANAVPYARLDMSTAHLRDVPDALFALSRELGGRSGTYHGRLRFPRLAAARLFLDPGTAHAETPAEPESDQELRERAEKRLRDSSRDAAWPADHLKDVTDQVVAGGFNAGLSDGSGPSVPVAVAAELLGFTAGSAVSLLFRRLPLVLSFQRRLEEVRDWFGRRRLLLPGSAHGAPDGYLALATLERMATARRRTGADDGALDTVLCQALLADLRDSYTRMSRHSARLDHRVVLVDEAEAPPGRDLLQHLLEARRQDRREGAERDRLTVIATARFDLFPGALDDRHRVLVRENGGTAVRASEKAVWGSEPGRDEGGPDVLGYRLPLLSREDCAELAGAMGHRWPDAKRTGLLLHRAVGGHAGAAALVARRSVAPGRQWPQAHAGPDLHALLPPFDPDSAPAAPGEAEEELCRLLLGGRADTWDRALWVHSAARDGDAAQAALDPEDPELGPMASGLSAERKDLLWGPDPGFALLRRLLQRRLAHNSGAPHLFRAVHANLADLYRRPEVHGAEPGLLYHTLAADGITPAAVEACRLLEEAGRDRGRTREWVGWIEEAATAPMPAAAREDGASGEAPIDRVVRLASEAHPQEGEPDGPGRAVPIAASLLAGLLVANDPFGCPCLSDVHRHIAAEYSALRQSGRGEPGALFTAANAHLSEAQQGWS